ncbi:hypothetical protein [Bdellovibrio svalbardensis]|uniref:DUF304 domain-containing protein n=1 Tax=Bdellovibrio svalbardensis TaxID=2972972 RepID=A0ABT6DKQ9_9BACT|nr:hypothetical protein [Bdellovibrio svalbardensis]MDG0816421.1 hypothetical protein [Bdellovibrio svalbardensis]
MKIAYTKDEIKVTGRAMKSLIPDLLFSLIFITMGGLAIDVVPEYKILAGFLMIFFFFAFARSLFHHFSSSITITSSTFELRHFGRVFKAQGEPVRVIFPYIRPKDYDFGVSACFVIGENRGWTSFANVDDFVKFIQQAQDLYENIEIEDATANM